MAAVTLIIQRDTCQPIIRRHTRQTTTNKLTLQRLTKHRSKHNLFKRFLILSGFLTTNTRLSHRIDCSINHINLSTNIHPKLVIFHPDKILPSLFPCWLWPPWPLVRTPTTPPPQPMEVTPLPLPTEVMHPSRLHTTNQLQHITMLSTMGMSTQSTTALCSMLSRLPRSAPPPLRPSAIPSN